MSKKAARRTKPVPRRPREPARARPAAAPTADAPVARASGVPITVGVGASAGGLDAFSQLLRALGDNPGIAIVFIQHLAPQHESALPALLAHHTTMPVVQVSDGMPIEVNHLYVIPPNVEMAMLDGHLRLAPRPVNPARVAPIDVFFRSLADAAQHNAIGVVLSGTASDGASGVQDIKAAGGFTIAQQPETAKYDGMPRAAIATGRIDLVLSPEEIGAKLRQLRSTSPRRPDVPSPPPVTTVTTAQTPVTDPQLDAVFDLLLPVSGVDFALYKTPTITRRLLRRMALRRLTSVDEYIACLRENPGEVHSLYQDLLIHVTRFFREPDSFRALADTVLPALREARRPEAPMRVWAAGCATGEEAYSLAIVLLEFFSARPHPVPAIQIFGTDVSESAIEHARNGVYPATIATDVSPDRLRQFFTKTDGNYRIAKSVRDLCIFARQDLTRDPPFSRLDLIFCRNVLIYLGPDLQRKLLSIFHYALKPSGYLVLGEAETIGALSDLFLQDDKQQRFYQRKSADAGFAVHVPHASAPVNAGLESSREPGRDPKTILNEANQIILGKYGPPAVVIDHGLRILQFRGQTGLYLEPAPGEANLNLLKMAREGLLHGLRTAVQVARNTKKPVRKEGLQVRTNGGWHEVNVEVVPLSTAGRGHLLVLFESQASAARPATARAGRPRDEDDRTGATSRSDRLQQELVATREYLQSIIQEVEAANEELQSANEEILSANEELQSTNEELDTTKEELQSTNEELNTVNEELHARNEELSRVNSDLVNLIGSVQVAVVIVSGDLRVRRFTPMAEKTLNLIPTDIGRPIGQIRPNLEGVDLPQVIGQVIDTLAPIEREVTDLEGRWYSLRVRPYRSVDNRIDGAVVTLFDIDPVKRREEARGLAREYVERAVEAVRQPVAVLDDALRITGINDAFRRTFGVAPDQARGRRLDELAPGGWAAPEMQALIERSLARPNGVEDARITDQFPGLGKATLLVGVRQLGRDSGERLMVVTALVEGGPGEPA